jgi:hypothetical protein
VLLVLAPARVSAEWQIKPSLGLTFGGDTTLSVDLEDAAGRGNISAGVSVIYLAGVVGLEADFGWAPGFFQAGGQRQVARSGVMTLTGNVVVTLPRRLTEYTFRPYAVAGFGLIRLRAEDALGAFRLATQLPAMDIGGGVTRLVTNRVGVSWDVRYFRNTGGEVDPGLTLFSPRLSFWRANMALTVRY